MRLVHWGFALAFFGLLGSGVALTNPDLRGIPFLGSKLVREIHLTGAVLLFVLPALAGAWDGFVQLAQVPGRLNAGQKLYLWLVVGLTLGLALTGTIIGTPVQGPIPAAMREAVYPVHVALAYCTVPPLVGHVLLATFLPKR